MIFIHHKNKNKNRHWTGYTRNYFTKVLDFANLRA